MVKYYLTLGRLLPFDFCFYYLVRAAMGILLVFSTTVFFCVFGKTNITEMLTAKMN